MGALFSSDAVRLPRRRRPASLPRTPHLRATSLHPRPSPLPRPSRAPTLGFPKERRRCQRARSLQPPAVPHPAPGARPRAPTTQAPGAPRPFTSPAPGLDSAGCTRPCRPPPLPRSSPDPLPATSIHQSHTRYARPPLFPSFWAKLISRTLIQTSCIWV